MLKKLFTFAILAFGVAVAVPSSRAVLLEKATPLRDSFSAKLVPGRLEAMVTQLNARINRGEGFPRDWERWLDREFTSSPEDPWGNLYYFQQRRGAFLVGSMGPDGQRGTSDDIQVESGR
jgi:hypothetical protein